MLSIIYRLKILKNKFLGETRNDQICSNHYNKLQFNCIKYILKTKMWILQFLYTKIFIFFWKNVSINSNLFR